MWVGIGLRIGVVCVFQEPAQECAGLESRLRWVGCAGFRGAGLKVIGSGCVLYTTSTCRRGLFRAALVVVVFVVMQACPWCGSTASGSVSGRVLPVYQAAFQKLCAAHVVPRPSHLSNC